MAIGWIILIAYGAYCVGFLTSSIFSATKIALMERRPGKREPSTED